jgi:uridine phosphorylase
VSIEHFPEGRREFPIACLAHVTDAMATTYGDFEKGEAGGALDALEIVEALAGRLVDILGQQ